MSTRALANMMLSGEFSDLKFVSQGHEIKVHKAVVCGQSPVIKAAVQGEFEESRTNTINMEKFNLETVKQLVKFLYTGDYDDVDGASVRGPGTAMPNAVASLTHHVCLNSIGDYYAIDELVSLADKKIAARIDAQGEDKTWVPSLPAVTKQALESTSDSKLLRTLASASVQKIAILVNLDDFGKLESISDFSLEVLKCCAQKLQDLTNQVNERARQLEDIKIHSVVESQSYEKKIKEKEAKSRSHEQKIKEKETMIDAFQHFVHVMRDTYYCRNMTCNVEFGGVTWSPVDGIFRCSVCKCKHEEDQLEPV
ncbi:speckle-type POZ protein-like protein [Ophiocordyceps sinensis CO18]|uniref:Speckle-type POZ protein-like protein n=1 Tax=Ophiocordyceps sinensis (strain Co18 / CGMCC 3.14243) TaxID=911162 RepID=T5AJZ1_OPHSC|nr:speckle-type POZ protein-like protein [Ophiocordyceps sinensis CO18]